MTSFPQLLMNRERGLPGAQGQIRQALNQQVADNLFRDCFSPETVKIPQGFSPHIVVCQDFAVFLTKYYSNQLAQLVQNLTLWQLKSMCKLWKLEILENDHSLDFKTCKLSECGMVLIYSTRIKRQIIVLNGEQLGALPSLYWNSIIPIGDKILGCWTRYHRSNDWERRPTPENSNLFWGEWNQKGILVDRHQLDHTKGRKNYTYACNEDFWVRLSDSEKAGLASIIEVFDLALKNMKTFKLPFSKYKQRFSSACIVRTRLFYGKNEIVSSKKHKYNQTICMYNLVKGTILGVFQTGAKTGVPRQLVANQHYVAWLEYRGNKSNHNCIKYLDISNGTVKNATRVPHQLNELDREYLEINLNIVETALSVTYTAGSWICVPANGLWRRKVIDMTNSELKSDVSYKSYGQCLMSNGYLLLSDHSLRKIYIESFVGLGLSKVKTPFRHEKPDEIMGNQTPTYANYW